jgi:hypothetical protein
VEIAGKVWVVQKARVDVRNASELGGAEFGSKMIHKISYCSISLRPGNNFQRYAKMRLEQSDEPQRFLAANAYSKKNTLIE